MAWLLLVPIIGGGAVYVGHELNEWYEKTTKPLYDYLDKENKDSEERLMEQIRSNTIDQKKETYKRNDCIRNQYGIKSPGKFIPFVNNTDNVCNLIFVNHYYAPTKEQAVEWAKKYMAMDLFDGQVLNKKNTKVVCIGVDNKYDLIKEEFDEYTIVYNSGDVYKVLNNPSNQERVIKCDEILNIKESSTDMGCKIFGFGF